jgi:hypothetical protein
VIIPNINIFSLSVVNNNRAGEVNAGPAGNGDIFAFIAVFLV